MPRLWCSKESVCVRGWEKSGGRNFVPVDKKFLRRAAKYNKTGASNNSRRKKGGFKNYVNSTMQHILTFISTLRLLEFLFSIICVKIILLTLEDIYFSNIFTISHHRMLNRLTTLAIIFALLRNSPSCT